ncbi:MAG: AMP-binding protein [Litoreibacter sp.]
MTNFTLIDAFTAQVARTPDHPALEDGDMAISYADLLKRVDDCTAGLMARGLLAGDHVALLLPRSWQMVVATLAILRCGAVVVPLDQQSPESRLQAMLATAECKLVIAPSDAPIANSPVVEFENIAAPDATPVQPGRRTPQDPAFLFFTSGSTGTPKAVLVPHRAVLRLAQDGYIPLTPANRVGSLSNPSFDAINFDIWTPLLTGGVCVIIPPQSAVDFNQISEFLTRERIDTLFLTVALFNVIVAELPNCFDGLGTLLIGGERINTSVVMRWYDDNPHSRCVIHNVYGPTECATFSLCYPIKREESYADAPIGHPLPGTCIHIDNETGELCIGGAAVGLGYYNQPNITQKVFVSHEGQTFYKTGDIVSLNSDKTVHFVGRIGRQAKIRGFRVEPGEVETLLETGALVSRAFVNVHHRSDAPAQLNAYLVLSDLADYEAIQAFMQRVLPSYMIPHMLFKVSEFPMTSNGKVNTSALISQNTSAWKPSAPDTLIDIERSALLLLAQEILERGDLTENDTFLTGGGDSLAALSFKHRLEQEQSLTLALPDILNCKFSDLVQLAKPNKETPPFASFETQNTAPATSEQRRLWLDAQRHPNSRAYSVPLIYDLSGTIDTQRLNEAVTACFASHPIFATAFADVDGSLWQIQRPRSNCRFQAFAQGQFTAQTSEKQTRTLLAQSFDLASAALCQVYWMPFDDGTGRLVINAHHIVFDGWALNLFLQEISYRYDNPDFIPDKPTMDMASIADWQEQVARQDAPIKLRRVLGTFWQDITLPEMPLTPLYETDDPIARVVSRDLPMAQLDALHLLAHTRGVTQFHLWMMVCAWAFSAITGRQRFNIASPTSNRNNVASARTVGMLANTLIFPVTLDRRKSINLVCEDNHDSWSQVVDCADVPLEHLYDRATLNDANQKLQFDCMFIMENTNYDSFTLTDAETVFNHPSKVAPKAPIVVFVTLRETGATLHAEVDERYFDADDAERFLQLFVMGLAALDNPDTLLETITAPLQEVLQGPKRRLQFSTIAEMLRNQSQKTPQAIALKSRDEQLSYAQMMARANALSHWISSKVALDNAPVVALYMDACVDHVIAIAALAQLNITILPIDPKFPIAAIEHIVALGQPSLILGDDETSGRQIAGQAVVSIPMLENNKECAQIFNGNPLYLLFTSGSTGTPKGVKVWDDTLCNLLQWQSEFGNLDRPAQTQQFSKLSFDVSFQEILTTLTTGGTLSLLPPGLRQDPEGLLRHMRDSNCERIFLPFVALKLLAETGMASQHSLPALKEVISAGETLLCTKVLRDWFKTMPNARLINHYGPTETHVTSGYRLPANPDEWPEIAPIGQAVSNYTYTISETSGELRVAGPFIRPCYLDQSHNDARFTDENPVQYLSGDRISLQRNNRLTCLGRLDDQIKVSGHRIERQEIETVLSRHPNIALALVTVTDDGHLTAFVELRGAAPSIVALNDHLARHLPPHVRLKHCLPVDEWPRTASGKIDRRALNIPATSQTDPSNMVAEDQPVDQICQIFHESVGSRISPTTTFWAAGANSLDLMRFRNAVQNKLECKISVADLFGEATTPTRLAQMLTLHQPTLDDVTMPPAQPLGNSQDKIAIIGLAANLPGASNVEEFASMILQSKSGVEMFAAAKGKVGARSQMEAPLGFDPSYFGISTHEATLMDPQQRQLLMNAVQVLADCGLDPARNTRKIGIIASCGENTFFQEMLRHADPDSIPDTFQMALHHDKDFLATKLAYRLGLTGPALTVQAACGSSLIGLHTAAGMLRNGDCDIMLVGASLIDPTLRDGYTYRPQHIFSNDGTCRPFDKDATGTIGASGVCFVALAPLSQAIADGHHIYCTLDGSAVNNDGADKMSYSAPSALGQKTALARALKSAKLEGSDIGYVEAHGTGTPLGDPIEIEAIDHIYGQRNDSLIVSSLKSQIGHLGAAAGLAGLIRATLAIQHKIYPPNLHFKSANPELDLDHRQIEIPATAQPWISGKRSAGISSFGIGGTNAHAVISQFEQKPNVVQSTSPEAVLISAHNAQILQRWASQIASFLERNPDRAADALQFLQTAAPQRAWRAAFIWQGVAHAIQSLRAITARNITPNATVLTSKTCTPQQLCDGWLQGARLDNNQIAAPAPYGFPYYPFDLKTYDFSRKQQPAETNAGTTDRLAPADWLLQPVWAPAGMLRAPTKANSLTKVAIILVDASKNLPTLTDYDHVITLNIADRWTQHTADLFDITLAPQEFVEFAQLINAKDLKAHYDIINLLPVTIAAGFEKKDRAYAEMASLDIMPGLVALARGLDTVSIRLLHVSQGASTAAMGHVTHPFANLLCGAIEVITTETGLQSHWLDFPLGDLENLSACLHAVNLPVGRSAFAHNQLWHRTQARVAETQPVELPAISRRTVIIGGSGGIGRNLCLALLANNPTQIDIIAQQSVIPEALVAFSERITMHAIDLKENDLTWPVFDGPVDDIIFAAGLGSYGLVANRDAAQMGDFNKVRTNGALSLETLVTRERPARVIYCSSLASELGGKGQLDYAATNGLLDGVAHWRNPNSPHTQRLTLNWDIWSESGMAVDAMTHDPLHREHLTYGLSDDEGRTIFLRALQCNYPQLLISTLPLDQARRFYQAEPNAQSAIDDADLETQIAKWIKIKLGFTDIDHTIPMEEIGIDSILMIDLLEMVQHAFGKAPELSAIAPKTTIADLATMLEQLNVTQTPLEKFCGLFAQILSVPRVVPELTLLELCVDSLNAIDLIEAIETTFGPTLSVSDFDDNQTVAMIMAKVADLTDTQLPVVEVNIEHWKTGIGKHVVCFVHPVGGETACYKPLLTKFGADVSIYAITDPKLRAIEPSSQTVPDQAQSYLAALGKKLDLGSVKVDLFGWSYGGWLVQEMAVQAERAETPFHHVAMIDPPDPECGSRIGGIDHADIQSALLFESALRLSTKNILGQTVGAPISPDPQNQPNRLVTCCALNIDAMRTHQPAPLLRTPASVFVAKWAAEGLLVEPVGAQDQLDRWHTLLYAISHSQSVDADHYSIIRSPAIDLVMAQVFDKL